MTHQFDKEKLDRLLGEARGRILPVSDVLAHLPISEGKVVADIGCGPGYFTVALSRATGPTGTVLAVDTDAVMLDALKDRLPREEVSNVRLVESSPTSIPLEDGSVDLIFAALVLHEVAPELRKSFLSELKRIAVPGASLAVVEWQYIDGPPGPPKSERISPSLIVEALLGASWDPCEPTAIGGFHCLYLAEDGRGRK